ncbi:hypothetical protein [Propionimicrobium lymphophilum]|uniref:hypothetical protein n=1 Tax=Propionimicrobium lymphophilum TaxID=33012 RepID=UPI0012DBE7B4|nr:hypothetical protein [Propionimicrobium lymphophilum]
MFSITYFTTSIKLSAPTSITAPSAAPCNKRFAFGPLGLTSHLKVRTLRCEACFNVVVPRWSGNIFPKSVDDNPEEAPEYKASFSDISSPERMSFVTEPALDPKVFIAAVQPDAQTEVAFLLKTVFATVPPAGPAAPEMAPVKIPDVKAAKYL